MKKIAILTLVFCLIFVGKAQAEIVTELNYSVFPEGNYLNVGFRTDVQGNYALMLAANTFDTVIGDYTTLDALGGLNFEFDSEISSYPTKNTLLAGVRMGDFDTRYLLKFLTSTRYSDEILLLGDSEMIIRPGLSNALKNRFMIGYQMVEAITLKAGIDSIISGDGSTWGLSFGVQSSF
ncbi:MAG: hypothetical protein ACQEQG_08195 [Bacillota bacterium]